MTESTPTQIIAVLRPGSRPKPQLQRDDETPPWVILGRHEWLALTHGLPAVQAGHWIALLAEALSTGSGTIPEERCRKVAGKQWLPLKEHLLKSHRIHVDGDSVHLEWVARALKDATKRIAKARKMRRGHDGK